MTTTDTPPPDEPETDIAVEDADASTPAASAEDTAETAEPVATEPQSTPFWQRPYVERYLVPFVLPLVVVVGLVMFVLNISRIFLSLHGDIDVIVGVAILLVILVGAAILSASPRMRSSSLGLWAAGFVVAILLGGWLSLGASEPEHEGGETLPPEGPAAQALTFDSSNALVFVPDSAAAATGVARITLTNEGGEHTFHFEEPETLLPTLHVNEPGETVAGRAFFGEEGEYVFYCTIPGHREAGMEGVMTVTGPAITLEEAEAQAEAAPAPEEGGEGGAPAGSPTSAPGPETETPTSTGG